MKPDNKKGRSKKRGPAGYYGGWARNRIVKAKEIMRNVRKAGKLVGKHEKARPKHEHLKAAIMLGIMMKRCGFSLRGMMPELYYRRGSRKAAGFKDVPSKSWLRKWLKRVPMDLHDGLILFTAGRASYGSFSTYHRFNRYILVEHAKEEKWMADICKHHALVSPDGLVLALMVTDGNAADATMFGKLCAKIPDGSGATLGDGAYRSSANCERPWPRVETRTLNPRRTMLGSS